MEIQVGSQQSSIEETGSDPDLTLATELVASVNDGAAMAATHYFDWAEELIGKRMVPLAEPFLRSSDSLVRYQAAWWLSFRKLDSDVLYELKSVANDEAIDEWARSGARVRLADVATGNWLPPR